jgi:hypothetical protein
MFYSEHSGGAAYEYAVVEKIGKRVGSGLLEDFRPSN